MFCSNCGNEINNNSKFCQHCGAEINNNSNSNLPIVTKEPVSNSNKVLCPKCGSDNIHFITVQASQNFDKSDACCGYLLCGPLGLLCGVKDKTESKTVRKCMNCNKEF